MARHEIIVGNVGTVYSGNDARMAREKFNDYVEISKSGVGRAGNEPVTHIREGEIDDEYTPPEAEASADVEFYRITEADIPRLGADVVGMYLRMDGVRSSFVTEIDMRRELADLADDCEVS